MGSDTPQRMNPFAVFAPLMVVKNAMQCLSPVLVMKIPPVFSVMQRSSLCRCIVPSGALAGHATNSQCLPSAHISEWKHASSWPQRHQFEQDLVISRVLIEISSDPFLGKTCISLFKLHLLAVRYLEGIDLVQVRSRPYR